MPNSPNSLNSTTQPATLLQVVLSCGGVGLVAAWVSAYGGQLSAISLSDSFDIGLFEFNATVGYLGAAVLSIWLLRETQIKIRGIWYITIVSAFISLKLAFRLDGISAGKLPTSYDYTAIKQGFYILPISVIVYTAVGLCVALIYRRFKPRT